MAKLALEADLEHLEIPRAQDQTITHHQQNHSPFQHLHPHPRHNNYQPNAQELHVQEPSVREPNVQEPNVQEPSVQEPNAQELHVQEPNAQEPNVQEHQRPRPQHRQPLVSIIYFVHVWCKLSFFFQNDPARL